MLHSATLAMPLIIVTFIIINLILCINEYKRRLVSRREPLLNAKRRHLEYDGTFGHLANLD